MPVKTENGMLYSMCAAWMSPVSSASRVLAQDACFTTSTLSPYCLNSPNSCAITTDAQSVRAMKPILIFSSLLAFSVVAVPDATALEAVDIAFGASDDPLPRAENRRYNRKLWMCGLGESVAYLPS